MVTLETLRERRPTWPPSATTAERASRRSTTTPCEWNATNAARTYECRPPWNPDLGTEWTRQPVAQLRYDPTGTRWTLYYADRNGRWHPYPESQPSNHIATLLAELTVDPTGIFWG